MTIHAVGRSVILGVMLPVENFAELVREHLRRYPATADVEILGTELRDTGFRLGLIQNFVRRVCDWGGYAGIGGQILKNNSLAAIRGAIMEADGLLGAPTPDIVGALRRLNALHGLGSPSFASKHLRFLRPDLCPVFDGVLHDSLPYSFDPEGYGEIAEDCQGVSRILVSTGIINPVLREGSRWFVADVESALFVHFNGWV
jgi:hypothetical protein